MENDKIPAVFNNYFSSVVPKLMEKHASPALHERDEPESDHEPTISSTPFHPTTPEEILLYIKRLKKKNNATLDGISSKLLKDAHELFSPALSSLINLSFKQKKVPKKMKIARVIPV